MDPVLIRFTLPADVPGIVGVLHAVAAEERWIRTQANFDVAERTRGMAAAYEAGRFAGFVADAGGTIVGEAGVRIIDDRALLGMAIVRAYRGRGIGRALMDAIVALLRERSIRVIELGVYAHNVAAIALYRSCGFVASGEPEEEVRPSGERWQAIPMTLDLTG